MQTLTSEVNLRTHYETVLMPLMQTNGCSARSYAGLSEREKQSILRESRAADLLRNALWHACVHEGLLSAFARFEVHGNIGRVLLTFQHARKESSKELGDARS